MTEYISQQELEKKVEVFTSQDVKRLESPADFHFGGKVIKFPVHTQDNKTFEAVFCNGYKGEKYLAALSTQIGCATQCNFCEIDGYQRNLTGEELLDQLRLVLKGASDRGYDINSKPIKASLVTGGEPLANPNVPAFLYQMSLDIPLQVKISSVYVDHPKTYTVFDDIVEVAAQYPNPVQFQISLNSTNEAHRKSISRAPLADFQKIRAAGEKWQQEVPNPRKIDLTFTISKDTPMDPNGISDILPSDLFAVRLRTWNHTQSGEDAGLEEIADRKLDEISTRFEDLGYLVIPGSGTRLESTFKMAAGQFIELYKKMRRQNEHNR